MSKSKHHDSMYYHGYLARFYREDSNRIYYIIEINYKNFLISGKDRNECKIVFRQIIDMLSDRATYINDIKRGMRYKLKMSNSLLN